MFGIDKLSMVVFMPVGTELSQMLMNYKTILNGFDTMYVFNYFFTHGVIEQI